VAKWNQIRILVGGKQLKSLRVFSTRFGFGLLAAILCWSAPASSQDSCQPVYEAMTKLAATPSHSYASMTDLSGGRATAAEFIYMQNKAYMKVGSSWTNGPMTPKELFEKEMQNRKNSHAKCQLVRSDSTEGQAATLYSLHGENEHAKEDAQVWVSKTTGLPLREEADIELSGSPGKRHVSNRYEYSNVRAPM
jgi:hypothetical protein